MRIKPNDPRRVFLIDMLTLGLFVGANVAGLYQPSYALGGLPSRLAAGKSVYRINGKVTVDGKNANLDTKINANSYIKTDDDSRIIFVFGTNAFILRSNSELQMRGSGLLVTGMRILTGKILSVFGKRETGLSITTSTATIGIRGTGIYIESEPDQSYICTCYGETRISANADPGQVEIITSEHHDYPVYVLPSGEGGQLIRSAPAINHTDTELALVESLVGRKPPFPYPSPAGYELDGGRGNGGGSGGGRGGGGKY